MFFYYNYQEYGIDWQGPAVVGLAEKVDVPATSIPLNEQQLETLYHSVNPSVPCEDHGITMYTAVRAFVHTLAQ